MSSRHQFESHYDAVVVGARCAGAATAMLLARRGLRVLAVDRTRYGSDTMSTHALMRGGVLQLHRWGVLDAVIAAGTPVARTTSFHYDDETIRVPIKARDGIEGLYSPRRTVLDAALVDAAVAAGAEVVHGVTVVDLTRRADGRVTGIVVEHADRRRSTVSADIVIGADGARSMVARLAGAQTTHRGEHATGVVYGYWNGLGLDGNNWYYTTSAGAGAIPTNDGDTCVFAATTEARFRSEIRRDIAAGYRRLLEESSPELAAALAGARQSGKYMAFAGTRGFLRRCWGPGWALVGDAGYFKDPITAHGISDALRDAELLANAVCAGSDSALETYEDVRNGFAADFLAVTDRIASFSWSVEEVKELHLSLSREMAREVDFLRSLTLPPSAGSLKLSA